MRNSVLVMGRWATKVTPLCGLAVLGCSSAREPSTRSAQRDEVVHSASSALLSACSGPAQVAPGYVGWWSFDEGTGDVAADRSANGNTGTLGGGVADRKPTWVPGRIGTALHFDGTDDLVNCGHGASLNIRGAVTVEAWIKPESGGALGGRIMSKGGPATYPYELAFKTSSAFPKPLWWLGLEHDGNHYDYANNNIPLQEWTHVAMVYDQDTVKLYVNGVLDMTPVHYTDTLLNSANLDLTIGARYNALWPFQGAVDELRVYNRALSADEVAGNFGASQEIVIKATDAGFSTSGATWSSFSGGGVSNPYRYINGAVPPATPSTATWSFTVPSSGYYKVYGTWTQLPNRPPDATFTINNANPPAVVQVDQRRDGSDWVRLGVYHFDAGPSSISLSSATGTADSQVIADAIKLVPARTLSTRPIVIGAESDYAIQRLGNEGADYLERMTCQTHDVLRDTVNGSASTGIALGNAADFPALGFAGNFAPSDPLRRDEFLLKDHTGGTYVLGATDGATDQALWEFLRKLGYRQLAPGDHWEVFPSVPDLGAATASLDVFASPSYRFRSFGYDHSTGGTFYTQHFDRWRRHNRLDSGFTISTIQEIGGGAARLLGNGWIGYQPLVEYINSNPSAIYYVNSSSGPLPQPNLCDDMVRKYIADYAATAFDWTNVDSISMEPPDGYTTCAAADCDVATNPLCSPSNQVVSLANEVGAALVAHGHADKFVGILAYATHYAPPTIPIHQNVWVKIQSNFDGAANLSTSEATAGWRAKMAPASQQQLSVGRYLSTWVWWRSLPGIPGGADLVTMKDAFASDPGTRGMLGVLGGDWVDAGLGYYLTARMSLDVSQNFDTLLDDYFTTGFGAAKTDILAFYDELYRMQSADPDGDHFIMSQDLVKRLYQHLSAARTQAIDSAVRARIDDLVLYTRYLELRVKYVSTPGSATNSQARQDMFEALLSHLYRISDRMIANAYGIWTDLAFTDTLVHVPLTAGSQNTFEQWTVPPANDPLKDTSPVTDEDIQGFIAAGLENNHTIDELMTPHAYSGTLVPIAPMHAKHLPDTESGVSSYWPIRYSVWVPPNTPLPANVTLTVTPNTANRVVLQLSSVGTSGQLTSESSDRTVPTAGTSYTVSLQTNHVGLHQVSVDSLKQRVSIRWADDAQVVVPADWAQYWVPYFADAWSLYFYVPKGTQVIGGYSTQNTATATCRILDPDGVSRLSFQDQYWQTGDAGFFTVSVPSGQDGKFWKFDSCKGSKVLSTVPPWLFRDDSKALLPTEVVNDTQQQTPQSEWPWSAAYSKQLVPATPLNLSAVATGSFTNKALPSEAAGRWGYFTWLSSTAPIGFNVNVTTVTAGKTSWLDLSAVGATGIETLEAADSHLFTAGASASYTATLEPLTTGLHKVLPVYDVSGSVTADITSPSGLPLTLPQGPNTGFSFYDNGNPPWNLYFYVPKNTTVVGGYYRQSSQNTLSGGLVDGSGNAVQMSDGLGNSATDFSEFPNQVGGYFQATVPQGQDGRLWKFVNSKGRRLLMTVPPYLARNKDELLLPAEVVTADSQ